MTPPLLVVAGQTAVGKSSLAVEVARQLGGQIVSADAYAVYRGMDIGTAKPSPVERSAVPHHLIDVADPRHRFSAGAFVAAAEETIRSIAASGDVPIVVGGSHFYLRALLWGLFEEPPKDPAVRAELERRWEREPAGLRRLLEEVDPETAGRIPPADRQRTIRALEVWKVSGEPLSSHHRRHRAAAGPRRPAMLFAPERDRAELRRRIEERVDGMFARGLVAEVEGLLAAGVPPDAHSLGAIGYREVVAHLSGRWSEAEARRATAASTRRLAKRQATWLRALEREGLERIPAGHAGARRVVGGWRERGGTTT